MTFYSYIYIYIYYLLDSFLSFFGNFTLTLVPTYSDFISLIFIVITIDRVEENWGPKRRAGRLLKESGEIVKDQNEDQDNERETKGKKGKGQRQGNNKKMKLDDIKVKVASPTSNSGIHNESNVPSGLQEADVGSL